MNKECKTGTIAYCGLGCLGLITEDKPKEIIYKNGEKGFAYVGIHLTNNKYAKIGSPWSSRNPKVVCQMDELEKLIKK